uniref:CST complex subunit STN1 n=1 Tax=Kalanchoe fedtschenkoi TaxID=63787 RepID=A0A7N0TLW6_KALFE
MDSVCKTHVKLLVFDLNSLTQRRSDPTNFLRKGIRVSRAETLGTVVSTELKLGKFLKFTIDDGTGCIPCILWLNHLTSPYFSRRTPSDVRLLASKAAAFAATVRIGAVVRVRGRIGSYRGVVQITVSDVVVEKDSNAEILHWLDCIRLAKKCYDVPP